MQWQRSALHSGKCPVRTSDGALVILTRLFPPSTHPTMVKGFTSFQMFSKPTNYLLLSGNCRHILTKSQSRKIRGKIWYIHFIMKAYYLIFCIANHKHLFQIQVWHNSCKANTSGDFSFLDVNQRPVNF